MAAVTAMKQAVEIAIQHDDIRPEAVSLSFAATVDKDQFLVLATLACRFAKALACRVVSCRPGSSRGNLRPARAAPLGRRLFLLNLPWLRVRSSHFISASQPSLACSARHIRTPAFALPQ